ncbi:MAG TPA: type I restriction-modification system endonuclease [Polyangiaceae bacterium]|nr:type I restriction-modification system endonuclease [Polyangiaceae bacterium]
MNPSPNFAFLAHHDPRLVALGTQAEEHFATDPNVTLYKLRQFCEVLAKRAAAQVGLLLNPREELRRVIDALSDRGAIGATQRDLFHQLRRAGNEAVHDLADSQSEALHQLKIATQLGIWFQRTFGNNRKFDSGPFVPPAEPKKADPALHAELELLRKQTELHAMQLEAARRELEEAKRLADAELATRTTAEQRAQQAKEEAAIWEALASQHADSEASRNKALEEQNKKLLAELAAAQASAQAMPVREIETTVLRSAAASDAIELDEAATRRIIDQQLRAAGWDADTERLTFERGARPARGKNQAIAEWPTFTANPHPNARHDGRADYVLFAGLQVLGVVEAKRAGKDVSSVIHQAQDYSAGYLTKSNEVLPEGSPWGTCKVPFLFSTNGRPYLRQLKTKSGIWFHDVRRPQNHSKPLEGWHTPEGLLDLLKQNEDEAYAKLKVEPMPYIDRDYQRAAILSVESALEAGKRELLLAMATGTGKTRTCIGLCYRLIKTGRFRRVLFLVDRNALGRQTADALKDLRLENLQTFTDIYDVKELADLKPERETRLHIATIQAMVKRVVGPFERDNQEIPPVDQYDCIVVDECHRGYLLDRELSDREFLFRDEDDYISKYRRVLDHFDAVKIGLTATPALHTTEIFGAPVFRYSYREAVVDGFLVDHDPPIRIVTKLAQDGIHYQAREEVLVLERSTQGNTTLKKEELPDEVDFEVDAFNRRVVVEDFNRVVLTELAKHIDPEQDEKTLIFCATDAHADLVVMILKEVLAARYGSVDNDAVLKITGDTDKPLEAIRRYRNERQPNIAVTVDLLTTGIDVPKIANLVFLRRVRSRILYEQMLGRATRLCPEIGKERFRVFDAVDLYSAIKAVTDMKPVVVNPMITFEQLVKEVVEGKEQEFREESLRELVAKLQRKKRALKAVGEERVEAAAGMPVKELLEFLKKAAIGEVADWLTQHAAIATYLDDATGSTPYKMIVSEHVDQVREVRRGYGKQGNTRPADYLETFKAFLEGNLNKIPALLVVTQRPRDLTREDLKQLKLVLDQEGFTEKALQSAWTESKNEDFAATIIGYIRQLALGSPLVPYGERVDHAVQRLRKKHAFTEPQRKWLDRIASQVKHDHIVDNELLEKGDLKAEGGGFTRLNKAFDGKLDALLKELAEEVWSDAS